MKTILLIVLLSLLVGCGPSKPLTHAEKRLKDFENEQMSEFRQYYFFHKLDRVYYGIGYIGKTDVIVLEISSSSSVRILISNKRFLRRLISELRMQIEMPITPTRVADYSWAELLNYLIFLDNDWRGAY